MPQCCRAAPPFNYFTAMPQKLVVGPVLRSRAPAIVRCIARPCGKQLKRLNNESRRGGKEKQKRCNEGRRARASKRDRFGPPRDILCPRGREESNSDNEKKRFLWCVCVRVCGCYKMCAFVWEKKLGTLLSLAEQYGGGAGEKKKKHRRGAGVRPHTSFHEIAGETLRNKKRRCRGA